MESKLLWSKRVLVVVVVVLMLFLTVSPMPVQAQEEAPEVTITVREGNDYATRVLGDPWDMNSFTDVEQGMNFEGRYDNLRNFQVSNGIFSATPGANPTGNSQFYALWPGYGYEMLLGKVGALYPVDSSVYKCMYIRARNTYVNVPNDDFFLVWWHNVGNDIHPGRARLHVPAYQQPFLNNNYRMYQLNLVNNLDPEFTSRYWNVQSSWPGIKIEPTIWGLGTVSKIDVDWIRLTDCQPVNANLSWTAVSGQMRLWASRGGQQKDVFISDLNPGQSTFTWDVQGFEPGLYQIGVENSNGAMTWLNLNVNIVAAPTVRFTSPSGVLGEDYAAGFGNPWDMLDVDFSHNNCSRVSWVNGDAVVETDYPALLPAGCRGGINEGDPQMYMNRPAAAFDGGAYRYLSFRMYINGDQPYVPDGMIGRLIWINQSGGASCFQVSDGIPYRIGWNTYVIDLWNPLYGMPEATSPYIGTGCTKTAWKDSHSVIQVRFDPNENFTGVHVGTNPPITIVPPLVFVQKFAWMRLTKTPEVTIGNILKIGFNLNKTMPGSQLDFYYTDDPGNPTQHPVLVADAPLGPLEVDAAKKFFLPFMLKPMPEYMEISQSLPWDTSGAAPGEYYICAVANDGYNQTTFCSEAPVKLTH